MPAFTFEKIAPPAPGSSVPGIEHVPGIDKKPHGAIVQAIGRFVETRVGRAPRPEKDVVARREQGLGDK